VVRLDICQTKYLAVDSLVVQCCSKTRSTEGKYQLHICKQGDMLVNSLSEEESDRKGAVIKLNLDCSAVGGGGGVQQ
jgi:hypothetical protein